MSGSRLSFTAAFKLKVIGFTKKNGNRSAQRQFDVRDKSKQGKYIHPEQLSLFSKKKLPWVGFEPTTLRVLGERSTS